MEPRPPPKVHEPEVLPPARDETSGPGPARPEPTAPPPSAPSPPTLLHAATAGLAITKQRKLLALVIAGISDAISVVAEFAPPIQWAVDLATAFLLFALLGFRWQLLPVLVMEAIPGLAAFPTWVLVVGLLATTTPTRRE
ncbi:MAG: hypothetical protein IPJ77_08900 [Planctomycetes bacterium]|nr:hypothetical protein [Planctomycetota bacterium]